MSFVFFKIINETWHIVYLFYVSCIIHFCSNKALLSVMYDWLNSFVILINSRYNKKFTKQDVNHLPWKLAIFRVFELLISYRQKWTATMWMIGSWSYTLTPSVYSQILLCWNARTLVSIVSVRVTITVMTRYILTHCIHFM